MSPTVACAERYSERDRPVSAEGAGSPTLITTDIARLFQPGARVKVTVEDIDDFLAYSALRKWEEGACLVLEPLSHPAPAEAFGTDRVWIMRFAMPDAAGEAAVEVLGVERDGAIRVTFPTVVVRRPVREYHRTKTDIFSRYSLCGADGAAMGERLDVRVLDLSMGSCAMLVEEPLPVDTRLIVYLASSPNERAAAFPGVVQQARTDEEGRLLVGVAFAPLSADARPVLVRLLGSNIFLSDTLAG